MAKTFTFDEFYEHLTLKVTYWPNDWCDENSEWDYSSDALIYSGPIPTGKADWEPEWKPDYDPECGDGKLVYEGEGEWTLYVWTREPFKR